jgi:YggT family protein
LDILIRLVNVFAQLLILLVILSSILSFFLDPYHPVRRAVDSIVAPLLNPIRRVVPLVGMFDFSPLVLILLIEVLRIALVNFMFALR